MSRRPPRPAPERPPPGVEPGVDALVVDLDGVVRHFDPRAEAEAARRNGRAPGRILEAAFSSSLLHPALTGRATDEQWREDVVAHLAHRVGARAARAAVAQWSSSAGAVDERLLEVLAACRPRAPVLLFTNATNRLDADLHRLGLTDAFDAVLSSCELGTAKPHRHAFDAALRTAEALVGRPLDVHRLLLLDDTAPTVEAARRLGWQAHHYRGLPGAVATLHRVGALPRPPARPGPDDSLR